MINGKRKTVLMKAISELKQTDYSREPELGKMYDRLSAGREQFAEVFDKNINAVMQISSLDLTMHHQTQKIVDISNKIAKATETIFGATSGSTNNPQEELTNTIIQISGKTDEVYKKIEEGQNELTAIKDLSSQTISAASCQGSIRYRSRQTCWRSTPQWRQQEPGKPEKDLPSSQVRSGSSRRKPRS